MKEFDLATLGSTMLSLSTEAGVPLLSSDTLRVDIAGAESNCAIALARLGKAVAWLSKVGDTPIGERVVSEIRSHGVDVSKVARSRGGRHELIWLASGFGANQTTVTYDRSGASIESFSIDEVDLETIEKSRRFHFTGITPALSEACRDTLRRVIAHARRHGVKVSCDVNYRSKLWNEESAREVLSGLIEGIDLLIVGSGDLRRLWGRDGEPESELKWLQDRFAIEDVILTRGAAGASALFGDAGSHQAAFPSDVVSPIGAGDAFAAGVLFSLLEGEAELSVRRGCAMAALARESRSDYVVGGREALEEKLREGSNKQILR